MIFFRKKPAQVSGHDLSKEPWSYDNMRSNVWRGEILPFRSYNDSHHLLKKDTVESSGNSCVSGIVCSVYLWHAVCTVCFPKAKAKSPYRNCYIWVNALGAVIFHQKHPSCRVSWIKGNAIVNWRNWVLYIFNCALSVFSYCDHMQGIQTHNCISKWVRKIGYSHSFKSL